MARYACAGLAGGLIGINWMNGPALIQFAVSMGITFALLALIPKED